MTELEKIQYAKMFLDKMASGINPLDHTRIKPNDLLMNQRISGCMAYVSKLLDEVIEQKAKQVRKENQLPLDIHQLNPRKIVISASPVSLSTFVNNLNGMYTNVAMTRLKRNDFVKWMISQGLLEEIILNGHRSSHPTAKGKQMGITVEQRFNQKGEAYSGVFYSQSFQQYLVSNIPDIILFLNKAE